MRFANILVGAALVLLPVSAHAQPKTDCTALDTKLPPGTTAWAKKADLGSAADADGLAKAAIIPGFAVNAALRPVGQVAYITPPHRPGGFGGMLEIKVAETGTYKVGVSSSAWVDLIKDKTVLESTAHGPGPDCSTIRKVVDFALQPGTYIIQIAANPDENVAIMVWRPQ